MDDRTDVQRRLDLHNISIDFAAALPGAAVSPISTPAGSACYRTGTVALVSFRTSDRTLSA